MADILLAPLRVSQSFLLTSTHYCIVRIMPSSVSRCTVSDLYTLPGSPGLARRRPRGIFAEFTVILLSSRLDAGLFRIRVNISYFQLCIFPFVYILTQQFICVIICVYE